MCHERNLKIRIELNLNCNVNSGACSSVPAAAVRLETAARTGAEKRRAEAPEAEVLPVAGPYHKSDGWARGRKGGLSHHVPEEGCLCLPPPPPHSLASSRRTRNGRAAANLDTSAMCS